MARTQWQGWLWRGAWVGAPALAALALLGLNGQAISGEGEGRVALAADPDPDPVVTFAKDVAPILQQRCQVCHQPGSIGPMSLLTYEDARRWAPLIKQKVVTREMPPYQYDTDVGIQQLKNDWRMTVDEIRTIAAWVDGGAELGNPADMPAAVEWPDWSAWRLTQHFGRPPDVVVKSTPYTVPAMGADRWWQPSVPSGVAEGACIAGVETKPSLAGRAVTHHANTTISGGGGGRGGAGGAAADADTDDAAAGGGGGGGRLSEFAMGKIGEIIPPDACRMAPANGSVRWDIHYYPNGTEVVDDQVSVGIWLHPTDYRPKYRQTLNLYGTSSGSGDLEIAPQGTLMTEGFSVWDQPVRVDSWQPHGHLRLVAAKLEVLDPTTGRKTLLSMVSNWNAGWHHSHVYEDDYAPLIPAGHLMVRTQWYDNSDNNPTLRKFGGDPDMWVGTGDRTADEMSHQWIAITFLDQEGYDELMAKRQANRPAAAGRGGRGGAAAAGFTGRGGAGAQAPGAGTNQP
jgi:hypothetical protein